jgi:thiamine biosynthesis lipoprotein
MDISWKKFKALGTEITISAILTTEKTGLLDQAEQAIKIFEKKFSRFISGNELAQFNQATDEKIIVSKSLANILVEAKKWKNYSQDIFDPTIINNLEQLGYDRSFLEIDQAKDNNTKIDLEKLQEEFLKRPRLDKLIISGLEVSKPVGLRLDLGGFGKGYILDQVSQEIFPTVSNYWLSAGGDLLISGNSLNKVGWNIGVQNPYEPTKEIFNLKTKGAKLGIATSGIWQRQGIKGGLVWHHLINPRTGLPADNNILAVTAIAESATKADVLAKTILILGEQAGLDFIAKQLDAAALIFLKDGAIVFSSRVKNYL